MKRERTRLALAAVAIGGAIVATGCGGGDGIAEGILENRLENAANEEGVDVDLDLSDGSFSVQSEDGSFEMSTDEDGNITFESDEGSMQMSADEDGNVSIEGEGADGEDFSIGGSQEGGDVVVESEDGSFSMSASGEIPDGFPDLPLPDGLAVQLAQEAQMEEGTTYTVFGEAPGDWSAYFDELIGHLESNGYEQQSVTSTPEGSFFGYSNGSEQVSGSVTQSGEGLAITLTVSPQT